MFSVIKTNLKHFFITFALLFSAIVAVAIYYGAEAHFNQNRLAYTLDKEGPHVFFEGEELRVNYVRGNSDEGFYNQSALYTQQDEIMLQAYFPLEEQIIEFRVNSDITIPAVEYDDGEPILAVSDIEGNYKAFRDFLIAHDVIDAHLNWQFGKGHLVLLGDFVDRGQSVTQVLWFIYKLEQDASVKVAKFTSF